MGPESDNPPVADNQQETHQEHVESDGATPTDPPLTPYGPLVDVVGRIGPEKFDDIPLF